MNTFNSLNIPGVYNVKIYSTVRKEYDSRIIKLEGIKLLIDNVFKRYNTTVVYGQIESSKGSNRSFEMTLDTFIDSLDRLEIMISDIHEVSSVNSEVSVDGKAIVPVKKQSSRKGSNNEKRKERPIITDATFSKPASVSDFSDASRSRSDFSGPSLMKDTSRLNVDYLSGLENELLIIGKSYNWTKSTLNNIIQALPDRCPKCNQDYWIQDYNITRGTNKGTIHCSCGYNLHEFTERSNAV